LGIKVSQNLYTNKGNIFDSISKKYPHSAINNLDDDHLDINVKAYEIGAGVQYKPNRDVTWGIAGNLGFGASREQRTLLDTAYSRFELASDITYFNSHYFHSQRYNNLKNDGTSRPFTINCEKQISPYFTISSAFSIK